MAFAASCEKDDVIPLRDIVFADHEDLIMVGDTMTLVVQLLPSYYNCNEPTSSPVWTSSNESVATVDSCGLVTGIMAGTVTITFTWGDFVCSTDIEVDDYVSITDSNFLDFCLSKFDENGDGILQNLEICTVVGIDLSDLAMDDVSIDLSGIEKFTALQSLSFSFVSISNIDLTKNTALKQIVCDNTDITRLDLSTLSNLDELDCHSCSSLSEIILPQEDSRLTTISCFGCALSELDLTTSTKLEYIDCRNNSISSLDLSNCPLITQISCSGNGGVSITFPEDFDLDQLKTYDND